MHRILETLRAHGGVRRTRDLLADGFTERDLAAAREAGTVCRPTRGWYAIEGERLSTAAATRMIGGALTCVSALEQHGIWVPRPVYGEHIRVTRRVAGAFGASGLLAHGIVDAELHAQPRRWHAPIDAGIDPPLVAVLMSEDCIAEEDLVAVLESMMRKGIARADIDALAVHSKGRLRRAIARLDSRSDSGNEAVVRMRLRAARIAARPLVRIGPWTVDLLIGEWLVVEIDGFAYHSGVEEFERDRFKDRELITRGYTVLRFATTHVEHSWVQSLECIRQVMAAGWHRRPRPGARPDYEERAAARRAAARTDELVDEREVVAESGQWQG